MGVVAIAFGVAAAATVASTLCFRGWRHQSFHLALMMFAFWGVANVTDAWMDPFIDAAGFYAALLVWWSYGEVPPEDEEAEVQSSREGNAWALVVALVFLSQQISHFLLTDPASVGRMLFLNVLFAVALIAIHCPSADRPLRHIRSRWAPGHGPRPAPVVVRSDEG